jgi:hypothetical protein
MMGDGEVWSDYYDDPKVEAKPGTANHRFKFAVVEDAYNKVCTVLLLLLLFESILNYLPSFL